jgi:hypothetical protein
MKEGKVINRKTLDKIVGKTYGQAKPEGWTWLVEEGSCVSLFNNSMGLNYYYETHRLFIFVTLTCWLPIDWTMWGLLLWSLMVSWSYILLPGGFRVVSGGNYVWPSVESTIFTGWMMTHLNRYDKTRKKPQGKRMTGTLSEIQFRRMMGGK